MSDASKTRVALECFSKGNDSLKRGDYDYAIEMFFQCAKLVPDRLQFRQALRAAEYKKYNNNKKGAIGASLRMKPSQASLAFAKSRKKWADVVEAAEEALKLNPWESGILFDLAKGLRELSANESAIWVAQCAADVDKQNKDLYVFLAEVYEAENMFDKAIGAWEMVRKIDPSDNDALAKARQLAAASTIQRGRYEDTDSFRKQMQDSQKSQQDVFGEDEPAPVDTAEARLRREVLQVKEKLEANPANAGLCLQLGDLYRKLGDFDAATKAYQQGLDATGGADLDLKARILDCQIDPLRQNLAVVRQRLESLDPKATNAAEEEKKLKSQFNAFSVELIKREVELYRFRTSVHQQDFTAHYELGFRLLQLHQLDEAIRSLQQARNDLQRKWEALYWLGYAFWLKKNYALADKNFSDSLEALPEGADDRRKKVLYYRGRVAEDRKDAAAAIKYFNEVAAIDYGYKDVAKRLDELNAAAS